MFKRLLQSEGIDLNYNDDGVVDINWLLEFMYKRLLELLSVLQAIFGNVVNLSSETLNCLSQSTDPIQHLKDQDQRDGLIFSMKDIQNSIAFQDQSNQITVLWDADEIWGMARWIRINQKLTGRNKTAFS